MIIHHLAKIQEVAERATKELRGVSDYESLESFRIKYLGVKGEVKGLLNLLAMVPSDVQPAVADAINMCRLRLANAYEATIQKINKTSPESIYATA